MNREVVMSDQIVTLEERLAAYPLLKERVEALLHIVEDASQELGTADKAELRVIAALRDLGNDLLQEWASTKERVKVEEFHQSQEAGVRHGKKNCIGTQPLER
jgi:hypothetical protein